LELKEKSTDTMPDHNNNHEDDDLAKSIIKLEEIQDSLGQIHDCDALLSFFERFEKFPETKNIMNKEGENRKNLYRQFVKKYRKSTLDLFFNNFY
jgi:CHAD domain-containing protein